MVPKKKALEVFNFHGENLIADWYPDNRIHECPPSDERANIRSATPWICKGGFPECTHLNKKREQHDARRKKNAQKHRRANDEVKAKRRSSPALSCDEISRPILNGCMLLIKQLG
jgi:hypothetical protein